MRTASPIARGGRGPSSVVSGLVPRKETGLSKPIIRRAGPCGACAFRPADRVQRGARFDSVRVCSEEEGGTGWGWLSPGLDETGMFADEPRALGSMRRRYRDCARLIRECKLERL